MTFSYASTARLFSSACAPNWRNVSSRIFSARFSCFARSALSLPSVSVICHACFVSAVQLSSARLTTTGILPVNPPSTVFRNASICAKASLPPCVMSTCHAREAADSGDRYKRLRDARLPHVHTPNPH